jgi:hypothetical protein
MNYAFVGGVLIALTAVIVVLIIRLWAKDKVERWGYDLTRETNNLLRETSLKLDTIKHQQDRLLSALERLERTASHQTSTLNDLGSRLSQSKAAV